MPCIDFTSLFASISDLTPTAATIVGIYVALRGLNTWNRQLKGSVEYELARRLLRCTYQFRESIKSVRHPMMWANEMPAPSEEEGKNMSSEQKRYYGLAKAYQSRWDKVNEVRNDLRAELIEGEVIWGEKIHGQFEKLFNLQHELHMVIHTYLRVCDPTENKESKDALTKIRKKYRDIMYDYSDAEKPDEFSIDMNEAIEKIEDFLKPHLKK